MAMRTVTKLRNIQKAFEMATTNPTYWPLRERKTEEKHAEHKSAEFPFMHLCCSNFR
jgi:hypothetical protein